MPTVQAKRHERLVQRLSAPPKSRSVDGGGPQGLVPAAGGPASPRPSTSGAKRRPVAKSGGRAVSARKAKLIEAKAAAKAARPKTSGWTRRASKINGDVHGAIKSKAVAQARARIEARNAAMRDGVAGGVRLPPAKNAARQSPGRHTGGRPSPILPTVPQPPGLSGARPQTSPAGTSPRVRILGGISGGSPGGVSPGARPGSRASPRTPRTPASAGADSPQQLAPGEQWRMAMVVGYSVDAQRTLSGVWYKGSVVAVNSANGKVKIHFHVLATDANGGGNQVADEWIPRTSKNLLKLGTIAYGGVHDGLLEDQRTGGALRPLLQKLFLPQGGDDARWIRRWQLRLADCGVFAAEQLRAALMTWSPAALALVPPTPVFKRHMREVNTLLVTRGRPDQLGGPREPLSLEQMTRLSQLLQEGDTTWAGGGGKGGGKSGGKGCV